MANSVGYHEPVELISTRTQDLHRALASLQEELEAIDWYAQRVDAVEDAELRAILAHNRDEEKEHASMLLEWIRRHDGPFQAPLREYLFTEGSLTALEADAASFAPTSGTPSAALTIGSLKGVRP